MIKGFLVAAVLLLSYYVFAQEGNAWLVKKGQVLPTFTVEGKSGNKITSESLKGKVVLINFFATWCPPCRKELPLLQSNLWDKYKNREDFEVMVLAREEGWDKLDPFIEVNKYTFPIYPDLKRSIFSLFAENTIPRNVLVAKDGRIVHLSIGFTEKDFASLMRLVEEELAK